MGRVLEAMVFRYASLGDGNRREDRGETMLIEMARVGPKHLFPDFTNRADTPVPSLSRIS